MKRISRLVVVLILACAAAGCARKQLLLVTEYGNESPRVKEMERAIAGRFKAEGVSHHLVVFNMDIRGRPTDVRREEMGNMAVIRVDSYDPDAVFVAGDDAARYFAQRLVNRPWRFFFFDVKGRPEDYLFTASTNVTGVRERVPVGEMFDLIKRLAPDATRVGAISGQSLEGRGVLDEVILAKDETLKVERVIRARTLDEWMAGVRSLQNDADVLLIASTAGVLRSAGSFEAVPDAELRELTAVANGLPSFTFDEFGVGPKMAMAGVVAPVAAQARLAAEMAIRTVEYGADVMDIRIVPARRTEVLVSTERAAALGVTVPDALANPPVIRREPTASLSWWEQFLGWFSDERRPTGL